MSENHHHKPYAHLFGPEGDISAACSMDKSELMARACVRLFDWP